MSQTNIDTVSSVDTAYKTPTLYDVVFFNDQKTHYEFVVLILMHLFAHDYESAVEMASRIHSNGRSAVATYTYEIASTKRDETVSTARANGHPLRVEIEPSSVPGPEL